RRNTHVRTSALPRWRRVVGLAAVTTVLLGSSAVPSLAAGPVAAAPSVVAPVNVALDGPTTLLSSVALAPGETQTVALTGVPASATSVDLEVQGRWSWKATRISVCAGTTASSTCTAKPVLTTP